MNESAWREHCLAALYFPLEILPGLVKLLTGRLNFRLPLNLLGNRGAELNGFMMIGLKGLESL